MKARPRTGWTNYTGFLPINLKKLQEDPGRPRRRRFSLAAACARWTTFNWRSNFRRDRVVLGTVAVDNPQLVADAILRFGAKRIVIGPNAKDGKVATHGWQSVSTHDVVELGHQMAAMGVQLVLYTEIAVMAC